MWSSVLRPFHAIAWDTLLSLLHRIPHPRLLEAAGAPAGVPVYVMLPLDTACESPALSPAELRAALEKLAAIGVRGVMVDVWWGLCEPQPGAYDFDAYVALACVCSDLALKVQAVMSFHACGSNIGDGVYVPLPPWVVAAGDECSFWFTDRAGAVNREYISLGADNFCVLPGVPPVPSDKAPVETEREGTDAVAEDAAEGVNVDGVEAVDAIGAEDSPEDTPEDTPEDAPSADSDHVDMRTPLQAYGDFIAAFCSAMSSGNVSYMGETVTELQIGMGPCGELRYPSYPLSKWEFPGIGEFQCYDKYLLGDLGLAASKCPEDISSFERLLWGSPPDDAGSYNDSPFQTKFFRKGHRTPRGRFFLKWYSSRLLKHCSDVLKEARRSIPASDGSVALAVKISGIHWWRFTAARPAEAAAGYYVGSGTNAYRDIAQLLSKYGAVLDFTCLEMRTIDQPFLRARCGPKQLVSQVFRIAARADVPVAGENALERYDWGAYAQILSAYRHTRATRYGFTLLRLGRTMLEDEHFKVLTKFVRKMGSLK